MYKESFKKHLFLPLGVFLSRMGGGDSREFTHDMLKCNTKQKNYHRVVFDVGHLLQLALVTTSPILP